MDIFEELKNSYINNKIWSILYVSICFVIFIFLLISFWHIYSNSSFEKTDFIKELVEDLDKSPIFDISNIYKSPNWTERFEYNKIKFGKWKGSKTGCACPNMEKGRCSKEKERKGCITRYIKKNKKYEVNCQCYVITKGECTEDNIRMICENIGPENDKDYTYYKNKIFYAKRKYDYSYRNLIHSKYIIKKYEKCPKGMKPCGKIDSFDNILCLNISDECPINNIIFNNKQSLPAYTSRKLNNNSYYHFNNKEPNIKLISNLFVFKGDPCYDSQEYNWINFHLLEKGKNGTGCKAKNGKIDYRYVYLESINQLQLYKDNFIFPYPLNHFISEESKEKIYNTRIYLFYRNFIGYDLFCLKKENISDLYSEIFKLYELAENERFFYSKCFNLFKKILELFDNISFILILEACLFSVVCISYLFKKDFFNIKKITKKIFIPELILLLALFRNIIEWKEKPKENKYHIIDKIYDCCDEYTKYQLSKFKRSIFDFSNFWTFKFYFFIILLFLIALVIILFVFFGIKVYIIKKNKNRIPLIQNENITRELDQITNSIQN